MIAALFVDPKGPYANLPGVDIWDESRDARKYDGPFPVIAHLPCARWGQLSRLVQARYGYKIGDDAGCFAAALEAVRRWGGVLEHPAISEAWRAHDITRPLRGGWYRADDIGGWTCQVDQSRYGHKAQKSTWLYACKASFLPSLNWARKRGTHGVRRMPRERCNLPELPRAERHITPIAFRDVLLEMARSVKQSVNHQNGLE